MSSVFSNLRQAPPRQASGYLAPSGRAVVAELALDELVQSRLLGLVRVRVRAIGLGHG
jgi:hypothetical protein